MFRNEILLRDAQETEGVVIRKLAISDYRCYVITGPGTGVIFICSSFHDTFLTYLCADSFDCFSVSIDLLLKWDSLKLLGIDRLKACITI